MRKGWMALAGAVACVAVLGIVIAVTARGTVLDEGFLPSTLERTHTIERVYDEVLVDKAVTRVTNDLTSGLPAQASVTAAVGVNVRLVIPPDALRATIARLSADTIRWFRGDVDTLRLQVDLRPVRDNVTDAASAYVSEVLAATPALHTVDLGKFREGVRAFLAELRAGRAPATVPQFDGGVADTKALRDALLSALPASARNAVLEAVETALSARDLDDALDAVAVAALGPRVRAAALDLTDVIRSESATWDVTPYLHRIADSRGGQAVGTARWWLGVPLRFVLWASVALLLASLGCLAFAFGGSWLRGATRAAVALAGAAVFTAVVGLLGWVWLGRLANGARQPSWAVSVQQLLNDNAEALRRSLLETWLASVALVTIAGFVLVALAIGVAATRERREAGRPPIGWRPGLAAVGATAAIAALVAVLVQMPVRAQQRCNGYAYLCDRHYDQVVSLATHNAMANSQDRFLFPLQDPAVATQLDAGARALQLDSYEWETPGEVAARVKEAGVSGPWASALTRLASIANPVRPGTWLCHVVCRAGASPFVPALRQLRDWLDRNPDQVVTIILQDETPAALSVAAFQDAGLVPYLAHPPIDPSEDWPTLRQMIASGHRLVAFTENVYATAPWLTNFYTYGEETPFSFQTAAQLRADSSCDAFRGGTNRRLFLLNHFVTVATGDRAASAEVNSAPFLTDRIERCSRLRGRFPSVVAVDFASLGQALAVVHDLNRRLAHQSDGAPR